MTFRYCLNVGEFFFKVVNTFRPFRHLLDDDINLEKNGQVPTLFPPCLFSNI